MRSLNIALTIIIFCFAMSIVNTVDSAYFESNGYSIFGFHSTPPISTADYAEFDNDNINARLQGYVDPSEQPTGLSAGLLDDVTKKLGMINMIINSLYYSTIGFGDFMGSFGSDDMTFIPYYITVPLTILFGISVFLDLAQYIRGFYFQNAG